MRHLFKRTVVLLNNFEGIENLLEKAVAFSNQHQTTLEVLYVHEEPLFDIPDYFLSESKIVNERVDKNRIKSKILEHLSAFDSRAEHAVLVYEDDTVDQVIHYAKGQKDILFITAYHDTLSSALIEKTPHSFWIMKTQQSKYQKIVLPIDFTACGKKVLHASKHIFDQSDILMLHDYRYLLDTLSVPIDYLDVSPVITPEILALNEGIKKERQIEFESYKEEFNVDGVCIDAEGALDQDLRDYISRDDFDLIIMYHQQEKAFLSSSLIVHLLDELSLDFFIFNL